MDTEIQTVAAQFEFSGDLQKVTPWGDGHINDTYRLDFDEGGQTVRYILQRINHHVFTDPEALIENIARTTDHLRAKLSDAGGEDMGRRVLSFVPTQSGENFLREATGNYWRAYRFIENAWAFTVIEKPEQAYEAAKAFGHFQSALLDLPEPKLNDTIPDFHNTRKRFEAFLAALEDADADRLQQAEEAIALAKSHEPMVDVLLNFLAEGKLQEMVTHNDTKINNVMLDDATGEGICVLDLDTVMPGLALYDFGDMVRFAANPATEDERDFSLVIFDIDMFELLVRGYLESAGTMLSDLEVDHLGFASKLMTFELGLRFLTDYLMGDTYFKTYRPKQNLDRAGCQFALLASMEAQEDDMHAVIEHYRVG